MRTAPHVRINVLCIRPETPRLLANTDLIATAPERIAQITVADLFLEA